MIVETFLTTAFAPAVAVALLFLVFGHAPEPWRARIQAVILALGFWAGCFLLAGFPAWPPQGGASALLWVAAWFAIFPFVAPPGSAVRYILRGVWVFGGVVIAVWSLRSDILTSQAASRNLLAFACLGWGIWSMLEKSSRVSNILTPIAMSMVSLTATSFLFLFKSSLLMSQMLTSMSVIVGGLCVFAWAFPKRLSLHAIFPFLGGLFAVFLAAGHVFLEINPWLLISMAIPFAVLFFKDMLGMKTKSPLMEAFVCIFVSGIGLGWVLWKVFQESGPLY